MSKSTTASQRLAMRRSTLRLKKKGQKTKTEAPDTPHPVGSTSVDGYEAKYRHLLTAARRFKLAADAYNIETIREGKDIDLVVDELMESRAALFNLAEQAV